MPPSATAGTSAGAADRAPSRAPTTGPDAAAISWRSCATAVECGTLRVPRDESRPEAGQIDLAVARRRATGPGARIGTLFFNPGGPGAAGTTYVRGSTLDAKLNERFDIVSWDPRGVGDSSPVACDEHTQAYQALDWAPDDTAEQSQLEAAASRIAAACAAAEPHLDTLTTDATARDLDALREAVGDDAVSFIGFSYGTYVGLRYAELFPTRVRAMVLDGVVDPKEDLEGLLAGQTQALEKHMDEVFASCRPPACPVDDAAATYDRVAAKVEAPPSEKKL